MAKEPKYEVEFFPSNSPVYEKTGGYWQIWFEDDFVAFFTEAAANKACEAFNEFENIRNLKRKVRNLASALECFKED